MNSAELNRWVICCDSFNNNLLVLSVTETLQAERFSNGEHKKKNLRVFHSLLMGCVSQSHARIGNIKTWFELFACWDVNLGHIPARVCVCALTDGKRKIRAELSKQWQCEANCQVAVPPTKMAAKQEMGHLGLNGWIKHEREREDRDRYPAVQTSKKDLQKRKNNKQKIKEEVDHKQAFHLIISYVLNLHPWFLTYPSLNLPLFI